MLLNQELLEEYAYLDELDRPDWAWKFLRRNGEYRKDYDGLQKLERPEPFDGTHSTLIDKWHVRRLLDYRSDERPEFFHEDWGKFTLDFMSKHPLEWSSLYENWEPPQFNPEPWKHSIICKDLNDRECSFNKIAEIFYPGHSGISHDRRHKPGRDRVKDDLDRFKKLQSKYLKIACLET